MDLWLYEKELFEKGIEFIGGVDEVGRGPLIGNVVAACCVLPKDFYLEGLNDSKKLSENQTGRYGTVHPGQATLRKAHELIRKGRYAGVNTTQTIYAHRIARAHTETSSGYLCPYHHHGVERIRPDLRKYPDYLRSR